MPAIMCTQYGDTANLLSRPGQLMHNSCVATNEYRILHHGPDLGAVNKDHKTSSCTRIPETAEQHNKEAQQQRGLSLLPRLTASPGLARSAHHGVYQQVNNPLLATKQGCQPASDLSARCLANKAAAASAKQL